MEFCSDYEFNSQIFSTCHKFSDQYELIKKIGMGCSANVFLILNKKTKKKYALKAYNHMNVKGRL